MPDDAPNCSRSMLYLDISPWKLQDLEGDDRTEAYKTNYARVGMWRKIWTRLRRGKERGEEVQAAFRRLTQDPDLRQEARDTPGEVRSGLGAGALRLQGGVEDGEMAIKLNLTAAGTFSPNASTAGLLADAGGPEAIRAFTEIFYELCFADPHIDSFIRDHSDPHGERFADWIVEKFGHGQPWSSKRATRVVCPFLSHGIEMKTASDRQTAHIAAWHSVRVHHVYVCCRSNATCAPVRRARHAGLLRRHA